jgi:hypothetical protein
LAVFYALSARYHSVWMVVVCLVGLNGAFSPRTSAPGPRRWLDAKVGLLQRPERSVLLAAPQALFGSLQRLGVEHHPRFPHRDGVITVVQRTKFVYDQTNDRAVAPPLPLTTEKSFWLRRRGRTGTRH